MSAGTVVISGGLLATVILLCIVAVLCYCRLQYYCCKKNESEVDLASVAGGGEGMGGGDGEGDAHFACNACSAPGMDSLAVTPLCLEPLEVGPPPSYCPTCSPFWLRPGLSDELHNGTERLGFHTYHYDNPGLCQSLPLSDMPQAPFFLTQPGQSPLSYYSPVDTYPNTPCSNRRPYSTPV